MRLQTRRRLFFFACCISLFCAAYTAVAKSFALAERTVLILSQPVMQSGGRVVQLRELLASEVTGALQTALLQADFLSPEATALDAEHALSAELEAEELQETREASDVLASLDNRAGNAKEAAAGDDAPVAKEFVDSTDALRRFSYDVEDLSVYQLDGNLYVVDSADKQIVRRAYDSNMRLVTQEVFPIPTEARNISRSVLRTQRYRGESLMPYEREDVDFVKRTRAVTGYNAAGLTERYELFHTETVTITPEKPKKVRKSRLLAARSEQGAEDTATASASAPAAPAATTTAEGAASETSSEPKTEERELTDSKTLWAYDKQNRVVAEEVTTWKTETTKKGEVRTAHTQKRLYDYSGKGQKPDVDYYENGELRMRTRYNSEKEYTETLFFDGGFSVETTYTNRVKTLEVVFLDGKEQRRRSFAQ